MFVYPWLEHTPFIECLKWGEMTRFWSLQVISVFSSFPSLKIDFHPRVENAHLEFYLKGTFQLGHAKIQLLARSLPSPPQVDARGESVPRSQVPRWAAGY